ncbi:hypothetical protein GCM10007424_28780 [Flavobacterium suaedae]|uniref:DUF4268 domain-containing protein n=1 Tax=Flavobacterium suaedae TaxID=1767027 RepID=A0ABQ1K6F7_9FLAO|nr:DUF4268 domain-containing protein [Flavobacterium suaedae]GGB86962.1 hypothetical protein GCM10007424_28780 [Flavobacterium suaedae]
MFSKAETQQIKKDFWTEFANAYSRKWLLYNTKIKDVAFKFYIDNKKARVMLDIEPKEDDKRKIYYEKIVSLKNIFLEEFVPDAIFVKDYTLENGKNINRIYTELTGVSLYNKASWEQVFDFFYEKMDAFERFFYEHEDYIKDLDVNT